MSILFIDGSMGAAGDMLTAALLDLLAEEDRAEVLAELNAMGVPGVVFRTERAVKCGITCLHVHVEINGEEEEQGGAQTHAGQGYSHGDVQDYSHEADHGVSHEHAHSHGADHGVSHDQAHSHEADHGVSHEHAHSHEADPGRSHEHAHSHEADHGHSHHGMREIESIVQGLALPDEVKSRVLGVYRLIAAAESRVHGVPVSEIHFHEVGAMDAVADIAAVMLLLHRLAPDEIIVSPLCAGSGTVRCAHGILPVPAPATALILEGVPYYSDERRGELLTPTGAAVLKTVATSFGPMPVMLTRAAGYGCGTRDFPWANCVRILSGERLAAEAHSGEMSAAGTASILEHAAGAGGLDSENREAGTGEAHTANTVIELSCNIDDMTAEQLGHALNCLLEAGAVDAWTVPIGMKKSRPGTLLQALCTEEKREAVVRCLFRETTTLGIRGQRLERYTLTRRFEEITTPKGPVRVKISEGWGVHREKPEYEDLARIAREQNLSLAEAAAYAAQFKKKQ